MPSAEARTHQHGDRSAEQASNGFNHCVRIPWRAARTCFAPWVEYRPTNHGAHAAQCGLGVVVLWADVRRAPPHVIGRGSTAPTPRQVGGTGFERPWSSRSNPVARGPRAFRPMEYRPNAHRATEHASRAGRTTGSATQQSEGPNRVSAQEGFRMAWSDITFGTGSERWHHFLTHARNSCAR